MQAAVADALARIGFEKLLERKTALSEQTSAPDFWNDPEAAQRVAKEQAALEKRIQHGQICSRMSQMRLSYWHSGIKL